jgi:hypothetical protein
MRFDNTKFAVVAHFKGKEDLLLVIKVQSTRGRFLKGENHFC